MKKRPEHSKIMTSCASAISCHSNFFFVLCFIFCVPVAAAIVLSIVSLILVEVLNYHARRQCSFLACKGYCGHCFQYDILLYSIDMPSNLLRDVGENGELTLDIFFEAFCFYLAVAVVREIRNMG